MPFRMLAPAVLIAMLLGSCASDGGEIADATTTVAPSTVTVDVRSSAAAVAMTTNPANETSVPQPEPSTTTTSTSSIPAALPMQPVEDLPADPIFDPILDHLAARTGIPVRLPVHTGFDPLDSDSGIVPTLWSASGDHYVVFLGVGPNCAGGNACRVASFAGRRNAAVLVDDEGEPVQGVPVELPRGLRGELFDAACGANCSDTTIRWTEGDVTYSVGMKAASGPLVLHWAWNALAASAEPPSPPELCGPGAAADSGRVARILTTGSTRWLVLCSEAGIEAEIVGADGALRWFDIDGDGARDLILARADGTSRLFSVSGIVARPVVDEQSLVRVVVGDLRCDSTGGRTPTLYDTRSGELLDFVSPALVARRAATPPTNDVCA